MKSKAQWEGSLDTGRPRASTVKDDHRLKMTVLKDRKKTYVDHSKEFKTAAGNSLSRMTISRRLNEVGFNSKKCAKKPLFPAIKVLKLAWPIYFVHECMWLLIGIVPSITSYSLCNSIWFWLNRIFLNSSTSDYISNYFS